MNTPIVETLTEALRQRAQERGDKVAFIRLVDGEQPDNRITFAQLSTQADAVARALFGADLQGQRVVLAHPSGIDFIVALFGCLAARVIAVPAHCPAETREPARLRAIVADCGARLVLTTVTGLPSVQAALAELPNVRIVTSLPADITRTGDLPEVLPNDIAYLQYTSGSTRAPRGVVLTHAAVLANQRMIADALGGEAGSTIASWLPLFHDMGLVGNVLRPVWAGFRAVFMSPVDFVRRPMRWLRAISDYAAHTSGGPDFGYELCTRRISDADLAQLDLSRWRRAYNGAEPVRSATLTRFAKRFAAAGFRAQQFYPCYGLAEATLFVSGAASSRPPLLAALPERELPSVSCGRSWGEQTLIIVDPETHAPMAAGEQGEVWVRGKHVASGYWQRPAETAATFGARLSTNGEGPFLRTGDIGCLLEGELHLLGRLKEQLIIHGRNHFPIDLEHTVEHAHCGLRPSCGAAVSVDTGGAERLLIVHELVHAASGPVQEEIRLAIRTALSEQHALRPWRIALIERGSLPRTTSGKVRRLLCAELFLNGNLREAPTNDNSINRVSA